MTLTTLARRSLRFHFRSHLGVLVGMIVGGAALTGALIVGDSVRETLRENALARVGPTHFAMFTGDRLFQTSLRQRLCGAPPSGSNSNASSFGKAEVCPIAYALMLPGVASKQDGSARDNAVTVFGVEDEAWPLPNGPPLDPWRAGRTVFINRTLASHLNVRPEDEIVLRLRKPGALSLDAAISPKNESSISVRLRVGGIVGPEPLGDFALSAAQTTPANIFLPYEVLARQLNISNRANLMLMGPVMPDLLAQRLNNEWLLEDGELAVRAIEQSQEQTGGEHSPPSVEVSSARIFVDDVGAAAALKPRTTLLTNHHRFLLDSETDLKFSQAVTNGFGVLTYLANLIQSPAGATPYSMVTAAGPPFTPPEMGDDEILVNEWLAEDLNVKAGDSVQVSYYAVDSGSELLARTNSFRVRAVVPLKGRFADRTLMPEFPGIAKAESTSDWDAGFPLVHKIRPKDESYWKKYRGTPKAFITLAAGQRMWSNRFGRLTAIRYEVPANASTYRENVYKNILANLEPSSVGLKFEPIRERALKAANEAQDFGGLFLGFSFFLVVSALLLMALLFQFSVEQRAAETGTLLALGFRIRQVRRLFLLEAIGLAIPGGILGALAGVAYARAMLWGLTTHWNEAVGNASLRFHASGQSLVIGGCASALLAIVVIWFTLRKQGRQPARELLSGTSASSGGKKRRIGKWVALVAGAGAAAWLGWILISGERANAEAFFGIGSLMLVAGLGTLAARLKSLASGPAPASISLTALAWRSSARRPTRALATIALLASGCFLICAIGAFRLDSSGGANSKDSGTGGFELIGQSALPIVHDLNTRSGREAFGLASNDLAGVRFVSLRVREGDEASCLNLNRAQKPRLLGVQPDSLKDRFTFSAAAKGYDRKSGWKMLEGLERDHSDIIPAIGDAASIEWAIGKKLGDTLDYVDEQGRPFKLKLVGAVANSTLQGNLVISEADFVRKFPGESGYRMFFIDAPSNEVASVSAKLSRAMEDQGLQLTRARRRLAEFNAVQNTYLNTFQVLGGLGLLLGSAGLGIVVLRNVMERRAELGLLTAVGYRRARLQALIFSEHGVLLLLGLIIGVAAAAIAVLPDLITPGKHLPWRTLGWTLGGVILNGALWTWVATRLSLRGNLLAVLRNE